MSALTEGVKAIYARKRRRLLQYDGGMSFDAIGMVTPPVRYETLERNALETLRNLTQAQLLDKTGMVSDPGDGRRFDARAARVGSGAAGAPRGGGGRALSRRRSVSSSAVESVVPSSRRGRAGIGRESERAPPRA